MCSSDYMQTFFLSLKIPGQISRQSMLFINWRQYVLHQTYIHTTFYHGNGLTWKCICNESVCYVSYLLILRFYFVRQIGNQFGPLHNIISMYQESTYRWNQCDCIFISVLFSDESIDEQDFVNLITEHLFGVCVAATPDKLQKVIKKWNISI